MTFSRENAPASLRAAVIDLNNNTPNQGMRCIREMLEWQREHLPVGLDYEVFDARHQHQVPDTSFDVYISSGGPGSPFDDEGTDWENRYFQLARDIREHNLSGHPRKKFFFFICHSFQLMCRCFGIGQLSKRDTMAFGVSQVQKTAAGLQEPLFSSLPDPFYVADFRSYQVLHPDPVQLAELGAQVLTIEKLNPGEQRPAAITAARITPEMVGTQFHPEADAGGMKIHFQKPEKKQMILEKYGEAKFRQLINRFDDPEMIARTHSTILPGFLRMAAAALLHLREEELYRK